ncbi:MAG: hypothetical protein KC656_37850, partial [Myxococcales bacterium]|nr:hypothetical protein [Myxococcales bacterium]
MQVETTRENYLVGEEVRVVVQVRDVGFEPVEGAKVTGRVLGPGGAVPIEAESDGFGEAVVTLKVEDKGPWRVSVEARVGEQLLGESDT